jgi:hypothetical protein
VTDREKPGLAFWATLMGVALLAGCAKKPPVAAKPDFYEGTSPDGVTWTVHGKGGLRVRSSPSGSDIITVSPNTLEIRDGHVWANGTDRGEVKSGDSVVLDGNGQLSVNDEKR